MCFARCVRKGQRIHLNIISMKMIRSLSTSLLAVGLMLCLLVGTVTPAYAAEASMGDYLAKALGVSQSELSNYATNYKNSLPIDYTKTADSYYVALGGLTAVGTLVIDNSNYDKAYTDQIAKKYGFKDGVDYENVAKENTLFSTDAISYINGNGDRKKTVPNAIKAADLITFQLDGAAFIESTMSALLAGETANWSNYVTDASVLNTLKGFRAEMTAEYAADFGQSNADSIAMVLEYMLYECIAYSHETMDAVDAIRALNGDAVILVLGLYNPMKNLSLTTNGKTVNMGEMIDEMIKVCNAYLLKQTANTKNVGFIDISATSTNGYSNITLNLSDKNEMLNQLNNITKALDKQYANQNGHDYIANQVYNNAKAPCKHSKTTVTGQKDATCKDKGYTGDTVCSDCGKVTKKGTEIAKTGHSYTGWTQTKAPTCTAKGEQTRSCKVCEHTETSAIDALGHKWDKGTITTAPTCTKKGVKTFSCTECQVTKTETVDTVDHKWDDGVVTTAPTCETKGKKTLTCTECSVTSTKTISATGHKWDGGVVTIEPSCVIEGVKTTTCTTCNKSTTEAIPTTEHTWDEGVVTTIPTCDTEGEKTTTCTGCGATTTETVPTTEHAWDEGTVTTQPTCENAGEKTTTCTICGKTTTEVVAATGHNYGEYVSNGDATCQQDGTKSATCETCGAKDTVADAGSKTEHVYKDGVCTTCNEAETTTETENETNDPDNTVVLVIVGALAAVVLAGAAVGFVLTQKKRIV